MVTLLANYSRYVFVLLLIRVIAEDLGLCKVPIKEMLNAVIDKTTSGWDQVTQSLVQLAILLVDTSVSSSPFRKTSGNSCE